MWFFCADFVCEGSPFFVEGGVEGDSALGGLLDQKSFFLFFFFFWGLRESNPVTVKSRGFIAFLPLCLDHWVVIGALAEAWIGDCGKGRGSVMV